MTPERMETILREMPEVEFLVECKWPLPLRDISVVAVVLVMLMRIWIQIAGDGGAFFWASPLLLIAYVVMMVLLALSFYHTLREPRFNVYLTEDAFERRATDELSRKFHVKQITKNKNGYRVWPYRGSDWHTYYG